MQRKHPVLTLVAIIFFVLCAISWMFGSLLHEHEWLDATCTEPRTCSSCHETDGEPLGHDWKDATCSTLKTCRVCGETDGTYSNLPDHTWMPATCTEPERCSICGIKRNGLFSFSLGHKWENATCTEPETCSICGAIKPNSHALEHRWRNATYTTPKTCFVCGETEGEPLQGTPEYDEVQQFFISLPTDVTMDKIEGLASASNLFCYSRKETMNGTENFMVYTVSKEEFLYGSGSYYIGKQLNSKNVTTCVVIVFNCSTDALEYILYLKDYGPYNGFGEVLYYNSGRFGDMNKILWDEYVEEDIGGKYYYYVRGIQNSDDETILNVTFRNDEDVPYYYRGKTIQTGFRICDSAEKAVNYTLPLPSQIE